MPRFSKAFLLFAISSPALATAPFQVSELPAIEAPKGLLGESDAPSLDEQRRKLAQALLSRGVCLEDYYGAEVCQRHAQQPPSVKASPDMALGDREVLGVTTEQSN